MAKREAGDSAAELRKLLLPELKEKCKSAGLKVRTRARRARCTAAFDDRQKNGKLQRGAAQLAPSQLASSARACRWFRAQVTGNKEELVARLTGEAPPPKKVKTSAQAVGIPSHLLELLDVAKLKKELKRRVKVLAQMVDADWCAHAAGAHARAQPFIATCLGAHETPPLLQARRLRGAGRGAV
jgi:hypothetical protein